MSARDICATETLSLEATGCEMSIVAR